MNNLLSNLLKYADKTKEILLDMAMKPPQHTGRKKKLAVGQKEDDHSEHGFEMKM